MQKFFPLLMKPMASAAWPTILRVVLGILLIGHGGAKLFNGLDKFIAVVALRGWPMAELQAFLAVFIEFAGGILLTVGLFTRITSFAVIVQFFIITFIWWAQMPFLESADKPFLIMVLALYVFFMGPGRISVDWYLFDESRIRKDCPDATATTAALSSADDAYHGDDGSADG
ncbi:MAG: DoxX family protein [Chlorobi bacterium]|nr:MAG: DoxX family protein [Bacteroidota bacterium]KXK35245.1 MAG: DoxX [Chlorobi bacterium OLB6]MBE2266228.1 DoxX family protein [Flavobacteriales bacterium]MBL1160558.1 DoxX family protein [Chlorobiota bacterium]MBW7853194.1 DoxX family protein [Candidatus Kapabacteria bacterium]MCC6331317.1 DoxX family protein [Ignavibacteria bacterium]